MKKKKRKKLRKKLRELKAILKDARRERKAREKHLRKARKKEKRAKAAVRAVALRLDGPGSPRPEAPPPKAAIEPALPVDNLREIHGLGPKIESLLHAAGITTFEQILRLTTEEWQELLWEAGTRYRKFDPGPWREQAARLKDGMPPS